MNPLITSTPDAPVNTSPEVPSAEEITVTAADGYRLGATRYEAAGRRRGNVIVIGATGVPQAFYRRFALHACSRGFTVLTIDLRGIGKSRPGSLKGFKADILDWAFLDVAAAVDAMPDDGVPLFMVGHSFGGHAFGLLPNHHRVARFYVFGTGAGWAGWMPPVERLRVQFMWKLVLPALTAWKGYSPWTMLGIGEDLPLGVYRQWRHWCGYPHYFFDDPKVDWIAAKFAEVRTPIIAANALDDLWALPRSRDAFMQGYRNAPVRTVDLDPASELGAIGHMGYFRQKSQRLWDEVLEWFLEESDRPGD